MAMQPQIQPKELQLQEQLDQKDKERQLAKDELNKERLVRVTEGVIRTITSPAFVEKMRLANIEFKAGKGLDAGAALLSIEALREAGADIPDDFRVTSRVFEDQASGLRVEFKSNETPNISDQELALASWGACGGAGGPLIGCGCSGWHAQ